MTELAFYYDVGSPYSYLAATRVEAIAADCGARVAWRPILLGGLFKLTGNQMPAALPERARYMRTDLQRWAAFYGVTFRFPERFPTNTLTAMRMLTAAPADRVATLSHVLFSAYWAHGLDISDRAVLRDADAELLDRADDPEVKQALIDRTAEAASRGAFGAPTFFVGDDMFFGNDRLPFVEQRLRLTRG